MPYPKSAQSAAQIIAAATRVIARRGYARSSLADIAREAGMSKGAVHYHFATKESLVEQVLEAACNKVAARTRDAWAREAAHPAQALRSSVRELWEVRVGGSDEAAVVSDLLAHALHDEALQRPLADYFRFAAAQTTEHLLDTMRRYGLRPRVSETFLPRLLLGLLDGLVLQALMDPDAIDPDELFDAFEHIAGGLFELSITPPSQPAAAAPTTAQPGVPDSIA